ncbi:MAG: hypothetical protein K2J79_04070 [Ruminiclostridium sp.]|nr:hypothetical protein [Ruminiclostridium sp.]
MAVYTILGVERKSGNFDDKKGKTISYDNIYLHCSQCNDYSSEASFGIGVTVKSFKIKNLPDVITSVFGSQLTKDDLSSLIGSKVQIFFDEFKNVDFVSVVDEKKAEHKKGA